MKIITLVFLLGLFSCSQSDSTTTVYEDFDIPEDLSVAPLGSILITLSMLLYMNEYRKNL